MFGRDAEYFASVQELVSVMYDDCGNPMYSCVLAALLLATSGGYSVVMIDVVKLFFKSQLLLKFLSDSRETWHT